MLFIIFGGVCTSTLVEYYLIKELSKSKVLDGVSFYNDRISPFS